MGVGLGNLASAELRCEDRDEVHCRARALGADGGQHILLIVNVSPHGLMGRCESSFENGERLQVELPSIGSVAAQVRWSLGGRLGCQFEKTIDLAGYYEMIAAIMRAK